MELTISLCFVYLLETISNSFFADSITSALLFPETIIVISGKSRGEVIKSANKELENVLGVLVGQVNLFALL